MLVFSIRASTSSEISMGFKRIFSAMPKMKKGPCHFMAPEKHSGECFDPGINQRNREKKTRGMQIGLAKPNYVRKTNNFSSFVKKFYFAIFLRSLRYFGHFLISSANFFWALQKSIQLRNRISVTIQKQRRSFFRMSGWPARYRHWWAEKCKLDALKTAIRAIMAYTQECLDGRMWTINEGQCQQWDNQDGRVLENILFKMARWGK